MSLEVNRLGIARLKEHWITAMQLYVLQGEQQVGPFDEPTILRAVESGMFTPDQLAWTEGQDVWRPLHELISVQAPRSIALTIAPPLPTATAPTVVKSFRRRLARGILMGLGVIAGAYVLLVLCGVIIGLMSGAFKQPKTAAFAPVIETAEARTLRRTSEYWQAMNQIRAEARAIEMPDMRLLKEKRFKEVAQQCNTAAQGWNMVAAKLRTLPTLDVDPELVELTIKFAEWFGEVADTCNAGYGYVQHAQQFSQNYASGGAMLESFVRGLAGDHPMNKMNEGREDGLRLQEHAMRFVESTAANDKRGNELITQFARLRAMLTQRYQTEFQ